MFTGSINNFAAGSSICVESGAVFMPSTMNNSAGALYVRGEANIPNVVVNTGFALNNEGYTAFNSGMNINGEITMTNHADATLAIAGATNLSFITIDNAGSLQFPSGLNLNSGTILNSADMRVAGAANIGGSLVNTDHLQIDGQMQLNSNGDIYNSCQFFVNANAIISSSVENTGLFLVQTEALVDGGGVISIGPDGMMSSDSLTLNGEVYGSGNLRIEGYSVNQGSAVGGVGDPLNVYDATQSNPPDYFDIDTGLDSNLERVTLEQPDPNDPTLGCTVDPVGAKSSIVIVKDSGTTDGAFGFAGDLGDFTLTTIGGSASMTFDDLDPGTYTVSEPELPDWVLTDISCSDGSTVDVASGSAAIDLADGEHVTCTFTNQLQEPPPGTIVIAKHSTGADGTFGFTGDLGNFDLVTSDGNARQVFSGLSAGTYDVSEAVPAGWMLDSIRCSGGQNVDLNSNEVSIELPAGGGVACVFVNSEIPPEPGSVTIVKDSGADNGLFSFAGDLGDFTLTTDGASESITFSDLPPATYSVSEVVTAGWTLDNISCSNASATNLETATASIVVGEGEDVTCTFSNSMDPPPTDTIIIAKIALGGDDTFTFNGDLGAGVFDMVTTNGHVARAFTGLPAGDYSVSELASEGWALEDIRCTGAQAINVANAEVTISLDGTTAGAACVFINRQERGSITVVKQSGEHNGVFAFSGDMDDFTLTTQGGSASTRFDYLTPGTYEITEAVEPDWTLTGLSCDDGSSVDVNTGTASVDLAAGENVTCTYTNQLNPPPVGALVVTKLALGGDATFSFGGDLGAFDLATSNGRARQVFTGLDAGEYTLNELVPEGWALTRIRCSSAHTSNTQTGAVTVSVPTGAGAVCTFVNRLLPPAPASITVVKDSGANNGTFAFSGDLGSFNLTTSGGSATQVFDFLAAGSYTISETQVAGWSLDSLSCDGDSSVNGASATVNLQAGENVTCTYVNSLDPPPTGSIAIAKISLEGDDSFNFNGDLGAFTLSTNNHHAEQLFTNLAPGNYTIAESIPAGWSLNNIRCTGTQAIDLAAGSVTVTLDGSGPGVACAFINRPLPPEPGAITIVKESGSQDGAFGFNGDLGDFSLETENGTAQRRFDYLLPGVYQVSEILIPTWRLNALSCDNGSSTDLLNGRAEITVAAGEEVTCTFTNVRRRIRGGVLALGKVSIGGDDSFNFSVTLPINSLTLTTSDGRAARGFGVPGGDYTVTEMPSDGWSLRAIRCSGSHSIDLANRSATITMPTDGNGEACVFLNERTVAPTSTLIVTNVAVGGDDSFPFSGDLGSFVLTTTGGRVSTTFTDLAPGDYQLSESVPDGWNLLGATCVGGPSVYDGDSAVSVTLEAGDTVRCVFVNNVAPPPVPGGPANLPVNSPLALLFLVLMMLGAGTIGLRRR
ncbi:hypothetical protein [Gilvimarinus xylanilyticus]|uniref:SpaA-like prealbumin fold domain-containing protein n=1 Tax=Gilvimarinus xylanilyticus TaxID=2944139 RepID=A0A9X2HXY3_9GAMM|nr:hypothetical protein [Gilvimarinus xylanilyticus]MCP8900115.1 hypothetical protein [Gilvimarinus xylanilyticus]